MCPQVAPCRAGWPPWGGWWPRSSHRAPDPVSSLAILPLMVPWCHHGATEPRCHGTKPPCCQGATVPWCHDAMVPWCHDAMVPRCHDAMVPWCHGIRLARLVVKSCSRQPSYCLTSKQTQCHLMLFQYSGKPSENHQTFASYLL